MSVREFIYNLLGFSFLLGVQVLFLRHTLVLGYAYCFVYLAGFLLLPTNINSTLLLLLGFATGLIVDIFYDSMGLHASASTLIAFLRPFWVRRQAVVHDNLLRFLSLKAMGLASFTIFFVPLAFLHHVVIFGVGMAGTGLLGIGILRILASTILTFLATLIVQLFASK